MGAAPGAKRSACRCQRGTEQHWNGRGHFAASTSAWAQRFTNRMSITSS